MPKLSSPAQKQPNGMTMGNGNRMYRSLRKGNSTARSKKNIQQDFEVAQVTKQLKKEDEKEIYRVEKLTERKMSKKIS